MTISDFFSPRPRLSNLVALAFVTACIGVGLSACGDSSEIKDAAEIVRYGYQGPIDVDREGRHFGIEFFMRQFELLFGADTDVSDTFERQLKRRMMERSPLMVSVFRRLENDEQRWAFEPHPIFERGVNVMIEGIAGEGPRVFSSPTGPATMPTVMFEGCINRCPVSARTPVTFSTGATEISLGREFYVTPFRGFVVLWPKNGDGFIKGILLRHAVGVVIPRNFDDLISHVISEPKLTNLADTAVP